MNAHFAKIKNAPGLLLAAMVIFCLTAGMTVISTAYGQGGPVPAPPQGPAVQPPAPQGPAGQPPAPAPPGPSAPVPEAPVIPPAPGPTAEVFGITCPPEYVPLVQKTILALMSDNFTFYPMKALDPFNPFISFETSPAHVRVGGEGEEEEPKEPERPLTPLQKMTVVEIERGLKAISWGELGRRALIEDSAGKGYIVSIGMPAGERNGVITQILNDRLVIQQEIWDRKARKRFPQDVTVKLSKKTTDKK